MKENNQLKIAAYDTSKKLTKALEDIGEFNLNNDNLNK